MSKKTFKNETNPALQFISTQNLTAKESQEQTDSATEVETKKSTFSVPMKRNPLYIETKSKRLQILMQPSLHKKLKDEATQRGTSLNDLIHTILEKSTGKFK